jgi:hypothetical protein
VAGTGLALCLPLMALLSGGVYGFAKDLARVFSDDPEVNDRWPEGTKRWLLLLLLLLLWPRGVGCVGAWSFWLP